MYLLLRAMTFSTIKVHGFPLNAVQSKGPQRFLTVFDDRAEAVAFDGGKDDNVVEIETKAKEMDMT